MADNNNYKGFNDDERSIDLRPEERDYEPKTFEEETAAEVTPMTGAFGGRTEEREDTAEANYDDATASGRGVGTFAIVLSILSLFFLPIILGAAGIIVGFVARRAGANALGNWAIGIGALSIILTVFFSPFF
ncbi:DUF4190 domain-containing protein [Alkalihalobacterium alkalinitrilicum]|uniref:DUF4190 domain-containing protein n=1 Tax=Alkalihalobacterium alkalinitrilicum TaxID=427920 RepID=UPI000ADD9841|nr:DUF4190 domain-containing protein [Alkalihalobacterium alkalinitrilicum]